MKKFIGHTLTAFVMLVMACGCFSIDRESYGVMSELTVSISISNTPGLPVDPQTKAIDPDDYVGPVHDGEKIQTLRIVIVRPDETIEHNRFMDFQGVINRAYMQVSDVTFKVLGPEKKKVYLFVNENSVKEGVSGSVKIVNYDFNSLAIGKVFPTKEIANLKITLNEDTETLPCDASDVSSSLPMSECHEVDMPDHDYSADLYVTRAAVKFTYIVDNQSSEPYSLSQLTIDKGSNIEYYMPQITYSSSSKNDGFSVTDYEVPNIENNNYYTFRLFGEADVPVVLPAKNQTKLDSFYLLEGKYTDSADTRNYSMTATLDGITYESYFPDVPWLPRNTHVVTVITIKEHAVTWTVDVWPYGEYWLNPGFGL